MVIGDTPACQTVAKRSPDARNVRTGLIARWRLMAGCGGGTASLLSQRRVDAGGIEAQVDDGLLSLGWIVTLPAG
jgi:hypothetical protein